MSEEKTSVKPAVAFVYDDVTHRGDPRMAKAIDQFLRILEMEAGTELDRVTTRIVPLSEYSRSHFSERNSARLFVGFFPADTPDKISVKIPFTEQDREREEVAEHYYAQGWHMGERLLRIAAPALHNSAVAFHEDLQTIRSKSSSTRLIHVGLMFDQAADLYPKLVTRHRARPDRPHLGPVAAMWMMWSKVSVTSPRYGCPDRIFMYDTRDFPLRLSMERNLSAFDQLLGETLSLIRDVSSDPVFSTLEAIATLGLVDSPSNSFVLTTHTWHDPRLLVLVAAMCDSGKETDSDSREFISYKRRDVEELKSPDEIWNVAIIFDRDHPYAIADRPLNTILFYTKHRPWDVRRRGRRF